jgi:ABC-type molybdate transport system permease subunit
MNWFQTGCGPGYIFHPEDSVGGVFLLLISLGIIVVGVALLWAVGALKFIAAVLVAVVVIACLFASACICIKIVVDAYRRRWPRG